MYLFPESGILTITGTSLVIVQPLLNEMDFMASSYKRLYLATTSRNKQAPKKFNSLIGSQPPDHYRHTVYTDPASLKEQIPLYSIRELYIWAMKLIHLWGPSYFSAKYMVSAFFAGLSVVVLSLIISNQKLPQLFLPIVVYFSGLVGIARLSTPDSLACFISLLLALSLLRKSYYSLFFIIILPFARTDFIILSILGAAISSKHLSKPITCISLIIASAAYIAINSINSNYGYLTIVNFTLISPSPYPANMAISSSLAEYAEIYIRESYEFIKNRDFFVFLLPQHY